MTDDEGAPIETRGDLADAPDSAAGDAAGGSAGGAAGNAAGGAVGGAAGDTAGNPATAAARPAPGRHGGALAPPPADPAGTTFAGLHHLVAPAAEIADRDATIAAVDALVAHAAAAAAERPRGDERTLRPGDDDTLRGAIVDLLATTLAEARARILRGLIARPEAGLRVARAHAHATDVVVAAAHHFITHHVYGTTTRTAGERLAVVAVGGYGRGEMAPFSDVDLLFLTPRKRTAWAESVVESTLYLLWDLRLKLGQSTRSVSETLRYATEDFTIRTNLLEMRYIAGDREPYDTLEERLWSELFLRTGPQFVAAKLAERDTRHQRHGGSRYLLEPNVKEGKGGLRDLQTLHWISRYLYRVEKAWELCPLGVFEEEEVARFA
ncbi:MAG: nucleotidyltransferase domain-containing protein, partial [Pseudomonadota bacterium]